MLHTTPLAEQRILVIGDIAGGVNARLVGLEVLIHHHAVVHLDAARYKEIDKRAYADAGNHHVARDFLAVRQYTGADGARAAKLANTGLHGELDAARFVVSLEKRGHFGREKLRKEAGFTHDHRDPDAFLGQNRSHFHADEAAADDNRVF